MPVELRPITRENWLACVRLKVAPGQEQFVASNAGSLAQAAYEPECAPLAVYDGATMVGFVMYALDPDDGSYWIYRLMIGAQHQRRGYGRAALERLIEQLRTLPGCDTISISYVPENDAARQLYASLGFVESGEIIEGEVVARLRLGSEQQALSRPPFVLQRLDHLVLTVRDLDATSAFYQQALGMELVRFGADRIALHFGQQKINLHLAGHEFEPKAQQPTPGSADLCFITATPLPAVIAHLEACGVPIEAGPVPRTGAQHPLESVYVRDPDHNLIEIANARASAEPA